MITSICLRHSLLSHRAVMPFTHHAGTAQPGCCQPQKTSLLSGCILLPKAAGCSVVALEDAGVCLRLDVV